MFIVNLIIFIGNCYTTFIFSEKINNWNQIFANKFSIKLLILNQRKLVKRFYYKDIHNNLNKNKK